MWQSGHVVLLPAWQKDQIMERWEVDEFVAMWGRVSLMLPRDHIQTETLV